MIKNIIRLLFSNIVVLVIGLVNSIIFPLLLSIDGYAMYQKYILYISYVHICQLGIASGMFINYGGNKYESIDKAVYKSEIYLLTTVLALFTGLGLFIYTIFPSYMLLMIVLSITPVCIVGAYKAFFQAWNRIAEYSIVNIISTISLTGVTVVIFLLLKKLDSKMVITTYLSIQVLLSIWFGYQFFLFTKGVKHKRIFSNQNIFTAKNGFLVMAGNYIGLLFHALDKQFVNLFYSTYSFAMYSFAMSTNSIMLIFITALSQPFYPHLAKGDFHKKDLNMYKEFLFMFGTISGCAYFFVAFIVRNYIGKYTDSLEIVSIYFIVFPAVAVINVLYLNMFKVTRQLKKYILTVVSVLVLAIILNSLSILLWGNYIGIAIATVTVYYSWLILSQRHFEGIQIAFKDYGYLVLFAANYLICVQLLNSIAGLVIYTMIIVVIDFMFYKNSVGIFAKTIFKKFGINHNNQ